MAAWAAAGTPESQQGGVYCQDPAQTASGESNIASIHDLPDFLLGAVLGLAGRSAGPAITLTCRRFQRLFYAESSLWRQCRVAPPEGFSSLAPADQEAWATAQAARLARVAPLVADVSLVGSVCQLAPLVALLQPASLRGLALEWAAPRWQKALPPGHAAHAAATAAALQRFPALTALELSFCPEEAEPAIPAALHRLPALRRLALRLANVPADIIAAAAQLQRLTFLRLSAGGPLPAGPVLLQLTRLQHLAHLELDDSVWPREHPLPLPPPSQYPALRSYRFAGDTGLYQIGHAQLNGCSFSPEGGGALTLHELTAWDHAWAPPAGTAALQALLEPLLPGGLPGCRPASLELQSDCHYLTPLVLPGERCPLLEHLTGLSLRCCLAMDPADQEIAADMEAFLAAALPRMGRLARLALETRGEQVPRPVLALPALRSLVLVGRDLDRMPAGAVLQGLEELTLDSVCRLPHALRGAPLRRLVLTNEHVRLDREDVDEVLLRLPHLRELSLPAHRPGRDVASRNLLRRLVAAADELVATVGGEVVAAAGKLV